MNRSWILLVMMMVSGLLRAQSADQILDYINDYKDIAITEMQRSGIPASIILAQGIHETQAGTSDLVRRSNNHFGIKCKSSWTGQVAYHDDDARGECFRSYATALDSYRDHSDFLMQSPRYAFLFKLNPEDYESWAYGIRKAGYATNIRYSQILIKLIKDYHLENYTLIALGKLAASEPVLVKSETPPIKTLDGFADSTGQNVITVTPTYPEGLFSINSTRVIFAKAGVSLLSLSNQYEIPLARLLEFNDMNQQDVLPSDQLIFLQRKRRTGLNPIHIVQPGENLYSIGQVEGVRYESLLEMNRMNPGEEPAPGEKVYLQSAAGAKPRSLGSKKPALPSS